MALPVEAWDPELFQDLQQLLTRISTQPTTSTIRRFAARLDDASPWITSLTHFPGPNEAERQALEQEPLVLPPGSSIKVAGPLLDLTNNISNLLSLSPRFSAVLAIHAEELRNHYVSRSIPEVSTYILHQFIHEMLDFLHELFRLSISSDSEEGAPFDTVREWVRELLMRRITLSSGGEGTLVDQILEQVDALQRTLDALILQRATGTEYDLLVYRVTATRSEQGKLVALLGVIARGGMMGRGHFVKLLKWLKKAQKMDGITGCIFSTFLALSTQLDVMPNSDPRFDMVMDWAKDIKFLKVASNLVYVENWAIPRLRETAKIQWSVFIFSAFRQEQMVAAMVIDPSRADQYLFEGVGGEAFQFLREYVVEVRRNRELEESEDRETNVDVLAKLASKTETGLDGSLLGEIQILIGALAAKKNFVKNLKNREEDLAVRRSQAGPPPTNYQAFLYLISSVYQTLPPDSAVSLWEDVTFISVIFEQRSDHPPAAFWNAVSAIARGKVCAGKAHEKSNDRFSWAGLCQLYGYYYNIVPHLFEPVTTNRQISLNPIEQRDVDLYKGWTTFISTIAQYSPMARNALLQSKPYPLQILFNSMNCELPLDVKAVVMSAIAAFTKRTGDAIDEDTINNAVMFYEQVTYSDPALDTRHVNSSRLPAPIGWQARMEMMEMEVGTYPLTKAYLSFLTSLIPSPGATSILSSRATSTLRRSVYYVLDRLLLHLPSRRMARESERWELFDAALTFLERALLLFDMSNLPMEFENRKIGPVTQTLWEQPGFAILLRFLSEPGCFNVISNLVDIASNIPSPRPRAVSTVLLHVLRIYYRILQQQVIFTDVLIPSLSRITENSTQPFRRPLNIVSFDHLLLNHLSNVNAIALLVGDDNLPISFLASKIMMSLADSRVFGEADRFIGEYAHPINRLAGIVDASDDSIRISQGFCNKLEADGADLPPEEERAVQKIALEGTEIDSETIASLPLTIRSTILDLLLNGTSLDKTGPNLSHFLLGFEFKGHDFTLQDPSAPGSRLSCLQVLLDQMTDESQASSSLVSIHPSLAAKSAQLMVQLFSHPITSQSTIVYASSLKGFSAVQLNSLPRQCPPAISESSEGLGTVTSYDSEVVTTASILESYLNFQRDIISCVGIETHAFEGHGASASTIAALLFDGATEEEDAEGYSHRPPLIIDMLRNITLQWREFPENMPQDKPLEFFGSFNFDAYKRADADWWDLDLLRKALTVARQQREKQGVMGNTSAAMQAEAEYLLRRLAVQNRQTDINIAKGSFLSAWSECLKVALGQLFPQISEDRQEVVLIELLDAILDRLADDVSPGVVNILCEALLISMSKLVEVLAEYEGDNLPVKQITPIFSRVIEAVVRPYLSESARGNLYAAINQYLSLLSITSTSFDDTASIASTVRTNTTLAPGSEFRLTTLAVLNNHKERFLAVLCRDAIDVRDVWKTECFALLGVIVGACRNDRDRQVVSPLSKDGYLALFVRSLKDREIPLLECLGPDAGSLHAYWVYESKISFLLAYASTRKGAEDLLDAGLFEVLAMCSYISAQPMTEESLRDSTEEAVTRQHRVLICALQLVSRTLASLHRSSRSGAGHAISFLNAHRDTIVVLLRENQQNINVTGIEECRLVISLLSLVHHKVPEGDIRSPSEYGAFHLAALSVAARFLNPESWMENMADQSDEARQEAEPHVLALNQVILAYLTTVTTGLRGDSGYPVLVNGGYRSDQATRYIASAPSLQMIIDMLSDLADAVTDVSGEYQAIADVFASGSVPDDRTIQRLAQAGLANASSWSEESLLHAFTTRSQIIFNMIESILLLVWRHLLFYANNGRGSSEVVGPDALSASFGPGAGMNGSINDGGLNGSMYAKGAMKSLEKAAEVLKGVLERLTEMDIQPDLRAGKSDAYFGMLTRRLGELTAGLT